MKNYLISAALLVAIFGFTESAEAQSNVRMDNTFGLTTNLAVPSGKTLTITGTITGSGPIGTTGTLSSGSFLTGSITTTGSLTVSGSFTASGASTLATLSATTATISTLTVTTENAGTASISTLTVAGTLRAISPTAGIGYGAGSGSTSTQLTSKATAVTINAVSGQITLNTASLASATNVSFTLTNSAIGANDVLIPAISSGGTLGAYQVWVSAIGTGSASLTVRNATAGTLTESPVIGFVVIKGSSN